MLGPRGSCTRQIWSPLYRGILNVPMSLRTSCAPGCLLFGRCSCSNAANSRRAAMLFCSQTFNVTYLSVLQVHRESQ